MSPKKGIGAPWLHRALGAMKVVLRSQRTRWDGGEGPSTAASVFGTHFKGELLRERVPPCWPSPITLPLPGLAPPGSCSLQALDCT